MGNSFDPDAFLASGSAAVATPTPSNFNPDAFLAQGASHPASSFNPGAFLSATAPPPPPSTTPASDFVSRAIALAHTPSPKWLQPAEERARAFVEGAGVPGSLKDVKDFVTRSPIQDVKDIYNDVTQIPGRVKNIGQTISGSPAATVARAPLSPEAFSVYGTAAGMLIPAAHEALKAPEKAPGTIPAPAEAPPVVGNDQFARITPVNERAGAAVPADNPAPAQSTILEGATQPEPKPVVPIELQNPRFRMLGSRARGDFTPQSDYDVATKLTPEEYKTFVNTPEGEYPRIPQDIINAANGGHDVFIETENGQAWKVEPHPVSDNPNHVVVERVSQIEKNLLAGGSKPITEENAAQAATDIGGLSYGGVQSWPADSGIPSTLEFTITEPGKETTLSVPPGITPEELTARRDQKLADFAAKEQPTEPAATQPEPEPSQPTSTKNVVTAAEREQRGIPPAEEAARRDFGTAWDEAAQDSINDPSAPQRLVEELADKPRPISDKENALVLRRQIELQNEHDAAVRAVNEKPGDATAEARLERVRDDLQTVYDVTKSIGTETGRGLNARKMLADNEFTLAKMEAETRAVTNQGKPLSPKQLSEVAALHDRIKAAEARIADYETQEQFRQALEEAKTEARAKAKTTTRQGFLAEQAAKARERIVARRGRLNTGIDPTALVDEAIIGAHHISNGLIKFSDWSAQMVKDLGDRIKPYLTDLWKRARQYHQESAKALNQSSHVKRLEQRIEQLTKAIQDRTAIAKTDKVKKEYDPETKQLIARRTALNAEYKKLFPNTPSTESKLAADKTRIQAGTEQYKTRTAAGNTSPLRPKTEPRMDKEKSNLLFAREEAKKAYHEMLVKSRLAQQPVWQKGFRYFGEGLRTARSIKTSFDLSAMFRQGGFNYFGHPIAATRAIRPMLEAIKSPKAEFHVMEEIRSRPNYPEYKQAGLFIAEEGSSRLSKMEEVYASRLSGKIPGVAASERAYTTYLNRVRADRYDAMKATLAKKNALTPEEAKIIANFVNVTTGRGHLAGKFQGAAETLNAAFFAPRYVISRFQTLFGQPLWHMAGKGTPRVRALIGKEYARTLTGIGLFMAAAVSAGAIIELDPRSSDFLKMRFGNLRIDPMMGIQQVTVLLSRVLSGKRMTGRGEIVPIRGKVKFGQPTAWEVTSNFARTKLGPPAGAAINIATGSDPTGTPTTALNELLHFALPLGPGDIASTMTANGVPEKLALALLAAGGMGVSNYSPQSTGEREAYRSRLEASDADLLRGNLPEAFKLRQSLQSTTPTGSSRGGPQAPRR